MAVYCENHTNSYIRSVPGWVGGGGLQLASQIEIKKKNTDFSKHDDIKRSTPFMLLPKPPTAIG